MDDNHPYQPQQPSHQGSHPPTPGHSWHTPAPAFTIPSHTPVIPSHLPVDEVNPVAVVQTLSVRGVEYWMLTISLWIGALALLAILLAAVNGGLTFAFLSFPVSVLLVCLPLFAFFFLRLKKAELKEPKLRLDPSKRRLTQFTQIITYAICVFNLIGLIFVILSTIAGHSAGLLWKYALNALMIFIVAGGILAYYWVDEHRNRA